MTSRLLSLSRNLRSLIICRRSRLFVGTALVSLLFPPPLVFAPLAPYESHPQTSKPFATARSAKKRVTWKGYVQSTSRSAYAFEHAFFQRGRHAEVTIWACLICHLQSHIWIGNACVTFAITGQDLKHCKVKWFVKVDNIIFCNIIEYNTINIQCLIYRVLKKKEG